MYKIKEEFENKVYTTDKISEVYKIIRKIKKQKRWHYVVYYYNVGEMIEQDDNITEDNDYFPF